MVIKQTGKRELLLKGLTRRCIKLGRASALSALFGLCLVAHSATLQIKELEDISWQSVPGNANRVVQTMTFCVASDPAGPFQLRATGPTSEGQFALLDGSGTLGKIRFNAFVGNGNTTGIRLVPGQPINNLRARPLRADGECRRPFTRLRVVLNTKDLRAAPSGDYSGRLILTVAPE